MVKYAIINGITLCVLFNINQNKMAKRNYEMLCNHQTLSKPMNKRKKILMNLV